MKYLLLIVALLGGCASPDYAVYTEAQRSVDVARHHADAAKYAAMASIANSGDSSAKVAAVLAMALGTSGVQGGSTIRAPQTSEALQWASIIVPSLTTVASINASMKLGLAQSDNSTRVAMSTNEAFTGIAGKIQAPVVATPLANVITTTTLNGTGTMGAGSYSTTDNHASTPTTTTLSGTGVLGSGSYSTNANPVTSTQTQNVDAGVRTTTTTDNHATNPAAKVCSVTALTNTIVCQ